MTHASPRARGASPSARPAGRPVPGRVIRGLVFVLAALLAACAGRLIADSGRHAYDPDARPPASYRLSVSKQYQLSAAGGVAGLQKDGLLTGATNLTCTYQLLGGSDLDHPLSILSTRDDPRDLDVFATFSVPADGSYRISCQGVGAVFVDDADNSQPDYGAALVVLACVLGLIGAGLLISGLAGDFAPPGSRPEDPEAAVRTV